PENFGMDEMHLFGHNIARQIWCIISGEYGDNALVLRPKNQDNIGSAMAHLQQTVPLIFEGSFKNDAKKLKEAKSALLDLWKGCHLSLLKTVNVDQISAIEVSFGNWIAYLKTLPVNVFTINQHYLTHTTNIIKEFGPLRVVSSRALERTIGVLKSMMRSMSNVSASGNRAMVTLSSMIFCRRSVLYTAEQKARPNSLTVPIPGYASPAVFRRIKPRTSMSSFDGYGLRCLVNDFSRREKVSTLVEENKDITTASILEWNTDTYHCHLSDKIPTRHNHFVRMFIPVDGNARRGVMSSENMTWGIYFGRILLFFLCEINGQTFTMCLVSIDPTTKPFPGTGIPTGSVFADDRKTFKKRKTLCH
ncbi:hypothetical protein CU098_000635, partial [Rhizopus stolonifer]